MKCARNRAPYTIFGYKGKQVRDNIHCDDLVNCFYEVYKAPRVGEVYNIGGSRFSNCSVIEAIRICEEISGNKMSYSYAEENRVGDHIWWISDVRKFQSHYPDWKYRYGIKEILVEIFEGLGSRELREAV
jgi:CDP-paratose 2-epimerase